MFAASREDIFQSPLMVLKAVQRFSVKVISFGLATPGCKLYVRHVFNVMSNLSGSTRFSVKVEGGRHNEIEFSHFLQNQRDCLPCRTEDHAAVTLYWYSSKRVWGGTLVKDGHFLLALLESLALDRIPLARKNGLRFCCSPLKTVSACPPKNFKGIFGMSVVFSKAHQISSFRLCVHKNQPNTVQLIFIRKILMQSTGRSAEHQPDETAIQEFKVFQSVMRSN